MKNKIYLILALMIMLCARAAYAADLFEVKVTTGTVVSGAYVLEKGGHLNVDVRGTGIWQNVSASSVAWFSTNESVATVERGVVFAQSKTGTAGITATATADSGETASASILVRVVEPATADTTVMLRAPSSSSMERGSTMKLTADVSPVGTQLGWSSSAPDVASVNQAGLVSALKAGRATISVAAQDGSGASDSVTLTVTSAPAGIELDRTGVELYVGGTTKNYKRTLRLSATVRPSTAPSAVKWHSSAPSVVTVGPKGLLTARKSGNATISATTVNGKVATCKVTVYKLPTYVVLPKQLKVGVGKALDMTKYLKINGTATEVIWKSSAPRIARIGPKGVVTGLKPGKTKIGVKTLNGMVDVCVLYVMPKKKA